MLGWEVEWSNSFRSYCGVVVEIDELNKCVHVHELSQVESTNYLEEEHKVLTRTVTKVAPNLTAFVKVIQKLHTMNSTPQFDDKAAMYQYTLDCLGRIVDNDARMISQRSRWIKTTERSLHELFLKAKQKYNEKDSMYLNKTTSNDSKNHEDSSEVSNGDDDEDEDEGEEDDEESAEDDNDEDEESSEEESSDESDEDSEEDEDKVDIKVQVLPKNEAVVFYVRLDTDGLEKIVKSLQRDFGRTAGATVTQTGAQSSTKKVKPSLFFRDAEGDIIYIKSAKELKYAYREAKKDVSVEKHSGLKLKLFAEFPSQTESRGNKSLGNTSTTIEENRRSEDKVHFGDVNLADSVTSSTAQHSNNSTMPSGNYEVIWKKGELLGSGSFGEVYSGINLANGERIAVKEVSFSSQSRSGGNSKTAKKQLEQARALQQEVKILSSLDHPNIIKYLGTECTRNTLRIFLELATNGTVKDALNEFGAFPEPLIRRYTLDILAGLSFLHARRFIHRDIKPTNLLISHGVVKLGDFGCSSAVIDDDNDGSNTGMHGTIIGTAIYMAPEVMQMEDQALFGDSSAPVAAVAAAEGDEKDKRRSPKAPNTTSAVVPGYGKKADMWSLGITLCEMASGHAPYKNAAAAIYSICVSKHYPTFPPAFSSHSHSFLSRCLVANPKQRANCSELKEHPFMGEQSVAEIRAQTASALASNSNTSSTVKLALPADASFFNSKNFYSCSADNVRSPSAAERRRLEKELALLNEPGSDSGVQGMFASDSKRGVQSGDRSTVNNAPRRPYYDSEEEDGDTRGGGFSRDRQVHPQYDPYATASDDKDELGSLRSSWSRDSRQYKTAPAASGMGSVLSGLDSGFSEQFHTVYARPRDIRQSRDQGRSTAAVDAKDVDSDLSDPENQQAASLPQSRWPAPATANGRMQSSRHDDDASINSTFSHLFER